MGDWIAMAYLILPIGERNAMARMAIEIMPDINEGVMFDRMRLSSSGEEPATHLMGVTPCRGKEAEQWASVFHPSKDTPNSYPPRTTIDKEYSDTGTRVKADSKSITILTDRIENNKLKGIQTVEVRDDKDSDLLEVQDYLTILTRVGLKLIEPEEEV